MQNLQDRNVEVKTATGVEEKLDALAVDSNKWKMLMALQANPQIYKGTVSLKEKKRRRAVNKRARLARKNNRNG